ncbi:hypothetical protein D9M68_871300 [compost metagenome]
MRLPFEGEELFLVKGQSGEVPRLHLAAQLRRRWLAAAFVHQHATAAAAPARTLLVQHQQAAALAFGRQPQALAGGIDGHALEQRIEMPEHAAGARLAHHAVGQRQPLRRSRGRDLQDGGARLADQVAIADGIAGQAFEIQLTAT